MHRAERAASLQARLEIERIDSECLRELDARSAEHGKAAVGQAQLPIVRRVGRWDTTQVQVALLILGQPVGLELTVGGNLGGAHRVEGGERRGRRKGQHLRVSRRFVVVEGKAEHVLAGGTAHGG